MKAITDLIKGGVFTTRLVTVALTGAVIYMEITGGALSETMKTAWLIIMGFWFNSEIAKNK